MGLIKAAWSAASGALADQWKEYFYCDALDADVLVAKGYQGVRQTEKGTTILSQTAPTLPWRTDSV